MVCSIDSMEDTPEVAASARCASTAGGRRPHERCLRDGAVGRDGGEPQAQSDQTPVAESLTAKAATGIAFGSGSVALIVATVFTA